MAKAEILPNKFQNKMSKYAFDAQACKFKKKTTTMTDRKSETCSKVLCQQNLHDLEIVENVSQGMPVQKFEQLNVHKVLSWIHDEYSFLIHSIIDLNNNYNWRKV